MEIQTLPDHALIENLMHQNYKAWGFSVGQTSPHGTTHVYVHNKNVAHTKKLLTTAGFDVIVKGE